MVNFNLREILNKFNILPLIDPQVKHTYGKLRSLGLLVHCLNTRDLGCLRPRAVYVNFPMVRIFTPRKFVEGKPPSFEYYCTVMSQREEENQGLIARSMLYPPFIAVIDNHNFVPSGLDRKLVPFIGTSRYYPRLYQDFIRNRDVPILRGSKNLFLQNMYEEYLRLSGKKSGELADLFEFDDPCTVSLPWWRWLIFWASMLKRYSWFRKGYQSLIHRDLCLWIEDRKQVEKITNKLLYLVETRFRGDPDRLREGVRDHLNRLRKRNSKSEGSGRKPV